MPKFDPNNDYYKVLGVSEDATPAEIQFAFRKGARRNHPDKKGDEETMRALNEAREVLGNPLTRSAYDAQRNQRSAVFTVETTAAGLRYPVSKSVSYETTKRLLAAGTICATIGLLLLIQLEDLYWHNASSQRFWVLRAISLLLMAIATMLFHSAAKCRSPQATRKRLLGNRIWWFAYDGIPLAAGFTVILLVIMLVYMR